MNKIYLYLMSLYYTHILVKEELSFSPYICADPLGSTSTINQPHTQPNTRVQFTK